MKKILTAATIFALSLGANAMAGSHSKTIKMGIILGFTGPIESLTPAMAASAELAFKEASDSGSLLNGSKIEVVRADSTCVDSAAATAAAEGVISQGVAAIMGADCSGVTGAIASNVAVPNGVVMISPSATSPGLTTLDDNGYFFRTAPSDARGGQILAGRSIKFWLGLFDFITTTKEDGIENFCKTEYGTDWQWAYSHYQKNKSFPSAFKQAA
jgi:branched-chain amino acid transport system substrate-binding protein